MGKHYSGVSKDNLELYLESFTVNTSNNIHTEISKYIVLNNILEFY